MTRARLAPTSQTRLVEVHGTEITGFYSFTSRTGGYPHGHVIRLPALGLVSAMFADQLRVADVQTGPTIAQYQNPTKKLCGPDVAWVMRTQPKEGPGRVAAIAIGRCKRLQVRVGWYPATMIELMIYDPTGKLVLVAGAGSVDGYRWTMDGGKPMLASVRSMTWDGSILEAKRRTPAAAP